MMTVEVNGEKDMFANVNDILIKKQKENIM